MRTRSTTLLLITLLFPLGCAQQAATDERAAGDSPEAEQSRSQRAQAPHPVQASEPVQAPAAAEPRVVRASAQPEAESRADNAAAAVDESQPVAEPDVNPAAPAAERAPVLVYYDTQADRVGPLVESALAREFVEETRALPSIEPFQIYVLPATVPEAVTVAQYDALPPQAKEPLSPMTIQTPRYYQTIFGPPLAYARPLDLVATEGGMDTLDGKKVLDFGYGQLGQVRLMAQCGADVVGADVSSLLAALYERESNVEVTGSTGKTGSITLHQARWPAGPRAIDLVGEGYDLFLARDVLRNGRMDPQAQLDPAHAVTLGVYPEYFLAQLNRILKPGALAMIYNTGRYAPEDWADRALGADIRSPFTPEQWQAAGFDVIALDKDDDDAMRTLAYAVDMHKGDNGIDPEKHVFARYTLVRKAREIAPPDEGGQKQDDKVELTPWGTPIRKNGG